MRVARAAQKMHGIILGIMVGIGVRAIFRRSFSPSAVLRKDGELTLDIFTAKIAKMTRITLPEG